MDKIKDLWEAAKGNVIAWLITTSLMCLFSFGKDSLPLIKDWCLNWMPVWLCVVIVLGVIGMFFIIRIVVSFRRIKPKFLDFKEMNIEGKKWRWDYFNEKGKNIYEVTHIQPICEICEKPMESYEPNPEEFKYICLNGHAFDGLELDTGWIEKLIRAEIKEKFPKEEKYLYPIPRYW